MEFDQELQPGILVRRYKRFLADVQLDKHKIRLVYFKGNSVI